ncbi:uncharacterized protein LOC143909525 [Arctopsyche grandis]|uniref:uncharacterized protein LOC143909525 n=1 Tax=Arctopsyche grandis TaxID=121162 RepID=UPI00406D757F
MKALVVAVSILIEMVILPPGNSAVAVIPALDLAEDAVSAVMHAWTHLKANKDIKLGDIAESLNTLQERMQVIDIVVKNTEAQMHGLVSQLSKNTQTELKLHELSELVSRISSTSRLMHEYMKNPNITERITLEDFATWCVSHNADSVSGLLERISMMTSPLSDPGLINPGVLNTLLEAMKESNNYMWEMQQSPNQLLYNMYNTIILTEIKGFAMMQYSWMILNIYGKGNFVIESKVSKAQYERRIIMAVAACKRIMGESSRVLWRNDPKQHIEGETYESLTRLLQGYIENEVDMHPSGTCDHNCAFYQLATNRGCYMEEFCSKQKACNGKIVECKFVELNMNICQSDRYSNRRYEWIEFTDSKVYGRKKRCSKSTTQVSSWTRWLFWHCSYCMCACDQSGPDSDRYFSLKEELADVASNKVVVGIQFVKLKRVIYMQICEGILLPGGKIDKESVTWKEIRPMDLKYAKKFRDYHELSNEERAIDLDDLEGPRGYIMTGVRFKKLGPHLNFEIQTTPFNFEIGELHKDKYVWISNDNTPVTFNKIRTTLTLEAPDIPTITKRPSMLDSENNQYVKFTHTDFVLDAAQTTIPFLDTQPVISKIPVPLSGAGIYHKGFDGSGGFVAPKIFTYDYSNHFELMFKSESEKETETEIKTKTAVTEIRIIDDEISFSNEATENIIDVYIENLV